MTINYIRRYAENINIKNDICDFSDLIPRLNGVSAVSWELPRSPRRESGEQLLRKIYSVITDDAIDSIHVMVQLVPEQPNTAIVNYKKTWGLIGNSGIKIDDFQDKKSFIDKGNNGLILTGACSVSFAIYSEIQKLINSEEKLFFSNTPPNLSDSNTHSTEWLMKWIEDILLSGGVIFFLLGRFDENDSEVVAVGKRSALEKII